MAWLVDTNIIVYRFDPRFPDKQQRATELLRQGMAEEQAYLPHQAIVEFVAATTRPLSKGSTSLLSPEDARREAEELVNQFPILYPNESLVRLALRGAPAYGLSWFDAHLWAFAEYYGMTDLVSENFEHDRMYGTVRAVDPFR